MPSFHKPLTVQSNVRPAEQIQRTIPTNLLAGFSFQTGVYYSESFCIFKLSQSLLASLTFGEIYDVTEC